MTEPGSTLFMIDSDDTPNSPIGAPAQDGKRLTPAATGTHKEVNPARRVQVAGRGVNE